MAKELKCSYCGRNDFQSKRGLTQHLKSNPLCSKKVFSAKTIIPKETNLPPDFAAFLSVKRPKISSKSEGMQDLEHLFSKIQQQKLLQISNEPLVEGHIDQNNESSESEGEIDHFSSQSSQAESANEFSSAQSTETTAQIYEELRQNHRNHVQHWNSFAAFTKNEEVAINLLLELRHSTGPLNMYDRLMHWHFVAKNTIRSHEPVSQSSEYISQRKIYTMLRERYNYTQGYHQVTKIVLPFSRAKAEIIWNNAENCMISLLTDPRITPEDYLWWGNSPLTSPPETVNYVQDLNTGRAYLKTYRKLITKPDQQVLLPVIFYIDGATTGHFADLPVTAVKFSLGIFTRLARQKEYCWRILGYIPAISKHKSKGKRFLLDSGHVDGIMLNQDTLENEGLADDTSKNKAQDFHSMLQVVLKSYIELQNKGFIWDLHYNDQVYEGVEFVLFTPFVRCDGEEADKLCGKYLSRGRKVAQLCRYCECPTGRSDDPFADYPLKTTAKISRLIRNKNNDELKKMSQHNIENAMYMLRFGCHNQQGIHGACPIEMLHAILLGVFKYTRDCFFEQLGETSQIAEQINALSMEIGALLVRQSDQDLPVTRFANGIKRGKLMAQEYPGILLCMAAIFRSTQGRKLLASKKRQFGELTLIRDWSMLVETLLQWERWLRSDSMEKKHVKKAEKIHKYIMYLLKKVAKREKGMSFKLTKFHGIVHIASDILNFGVPLEVDTGFNESGHKATKVAAKLTQRNEKTFDKQVAIRLEEVHLLELAKSEMNGTLGAYFGQNAHYGPKKPPASPQTSLGGAVYKLISDQITHQYRLILQSRSMDDSDEKVELGLVQFLGGLQSKVNNHITPLLLYTVHKRQGQIFRGHGKYRGEVWRDWVLIDWGQEGHLPGKIWGFLDLQKLPARNSIQYGGIKIDPGIYAVIETANVSNDGEELDQSEIFVPINKELDANANDSEPNLRFYLANVEAFVKPIAVIPDLGGALNAYFLVKDRESWAIDFTKFLEKDMDLAVEISEHESSIEDSDSRNGTDSSDHINDDSE
jgi:hypothetical protein